MTPPALTPAARSSRPKTSSRRSGRAAPAAKPRQPAAPRRVSGPISGAAGTGRIATSPGTRRVSGPARPARPARSAPRTRSRRWGRVSLPAPAALRAGAVGFVRTLPDNAWLDRIVRGRSWIPILGVLLAGIVAMQVEVLKLSASTGRALERGTALQSRNEQLRASVAVLSDDQRIERLAAGMGMVMPGPTTIKFLTPARNVDLVRALNSIKAPNATAFLGSLPATVVGSTAAGAAVAPAGSAITPAAATSATGATATGAAPASTATSTAPGTPSSTPSAGTGASAPGSSTAAASGGTAGTGTAGTPAASTGAAGTAATGAAAGTTSPSAPTPTGASGVPAAG